jgi:hypothetical protein
MENRTFKDAREKALLLSEIANEKYCIYKYNNADSDMFGHHIIVSESNSSIYKNESYLVLIEKVSPIQTA